MQGLSNPQPFRATKEVENDPEDVDEEETGQGKKKHMKKRKKKKKQNKSQAVTGKPEPAECKYEPAKFKESYTSFLLDAKSKGMKHSDAMSAWKQSPERADLLKGMPMSELKRRRFV